MKKTFFTASIVLLISANCFSQSTLKTDEPVEKTDYLQKSKNQRITAWVFLGTGAVINIIGVANYMKVDPWEYLIVGSAIMFVSIPFSIAANKNKKKAMSLSFKNEMVQQLTGNNYVFKPVPSLTLKIKL